MADSLSSLLLALAFLAVFWRAYGTDSDFSLEDALDLDPVPTKKPIPKRPKLPTQDSGDLDLSDFFDTPVKPTPKPKPTRPTKVPASKPGGIDFFDTPSKPTPKPSRPTKKVPARKPDPNDFDLSDALDGRNDGKYDGRGGGGDLSDDDLEDIFNDGYSPDKKKGGRGGAGGGESGSNTDSNTGETMETGTIAGIASALAMALVGAVTSYFSYQQKKFCFSIQQGLNVDYLKGEQMEGVVAEEPQVKYSAVESQASAPPTEDAAKV
ncbi:CD99 antigen-like protein 2 isoform X2 [Bombina bombina]|uniref:CD99 antigen-like protein 2 isoform X2 n=1 Tax=Bombina bombina TaxID=8345 RepID=UPI00235B05E0|nr:CD99 antigen-like protein 2 isoform X2 [Bombina bombina]